MSACLDVCRFYIKGSVALSDQIQPQTVNQWLFSNEAAAMAITMERVGELYQMVKTKFIDTVDPDQLEKEEKKFDRLKEEWLEEWTKHGHGHCHSHGNEHHGPMCDTESLQKQSKEFVTEEPAQFRAVLCKQFFEAQADLAKESFEAAIFKAVLENSFFKDVKSVAAFGCGPASELIGFQAFLGGLPKETQPQTVELVGYDAEEGWREYAEEIGCTFKCQKIDAKFVEEMPKYDIIILCYSAHHMPFNKATDGDKTMWEMLAEKGQLVVVIDFYILDQDETLKREKFTVFKIKEQHPVVPAGNVLAYFKLSQ